MDGGSKSQKVTNTLLLYSGYIVYGASRTLFGPTLLDLQESTDSRTDQISIIFIINAFAGLAGGVASAFLVNRLNGWIFLAVTAALLGLSEIYLSLCTNLITLGVAFSFNIFVALMFDGAVNVYLLQIWGDDNGPWMQALHFVFAIGAWMGPLIATPFLSSATNNSFNASFAKQLDPNSTAASADHSSSQFKYAYFIIGGLCILHSFSCLLMFFIRARSCNLISSKKSNENQAGGEEKLSDFNKVFVITFSSLIFVFFWMQVGLEFIFDTYLTTYTVEELNWAKTTGATLTAVFWGAIAAGRGVGIFLVKYVQAGQLIISMCIYKVWNFFKLPRIN